MCDEEKKLIDDYNMYFTPYQCQYTSAEQQASEFRIVSVLKTIDTSESKNSILLPKKN